MGLPDPVKGFEATFSTMFKKCRLVGVVRGQGGRW